MTENERMYSQMIFWDSIRTNNFFISGNLNGIGAFEAVVTEKEIHHISRSLLPSYAWDSITHRIYLDMFLKLRSGQGALLEQGFAAIYVSYHSAQEMLYDFYKNDPRVTTIGSRSPLLTESQYQTLMQLLIQNPTIDLKSMLLNFHKDNFRVALNLDNINLDLLLNIQSIFGININELEDGVISSAMEQWWLNYDFSNSLNFPLLSNGGNLNTNIFFNQFNQLKIKNIPYFQRSFKVGTSLINS